jgi:hypothetical protein
MDSSATFPELPLDRVGGYVAYLAYRGTRAETIARRLQLECDLAQGNRPGGMPGYCYVCRRKVHFTFDYEYAIEMDGLRMPNFREKMNCSVCGFNNRMRAAVQVLDGLAPPRPGRAIYLTEQVTPMYALFCERYDKVTGSEYLGDAVPYGQTDERGVRNESVTKITFGDEEFDAIASFDVLEDVPDYGIAFRDFWRILKPGGYCSSLCRSRVCRTRSCARA